MYKLAVIDELQDKRREDENRECRVKDISDLTIPKNAK